jgi:hypothetical protein
VPLEGHWQRQHTPLHGVSRRELRTLAIVAAVVAIGVAIALYAALHHGSRTAASGCIEATTPSTTGAATVHACGAEAVSLCRSQAGLRDPSARAILAACRRAGLSARP